MKRFLLYEAGLTPTEQEIWRQAGFDIVAVDSTGSTDASTRADVVLDMGRSEAPLELSELLRQQAKLFIMPSYGFRQLPENAWSGYELHALGDGELRWLFATRLESALPDDLGILLTEEARPAFAESLYYYLLRDVFRETAEWCGHMSSVVGRM